MKLYLAAEKDKVFSNVEVLIYVFDIDSGDLAIDLKSFEDIMTALGENSPNAIIFALIHKMDLINLEDRDAAFKERESLLRSYCPTYVTYILSLSVR